MTEANQNCDSTQSVHAGEVRHKPYHTLIDPLVPTATYVFDDFADIQHFISDQNNKIPSERLDYGRYGNPTIRAVEQRLAALENGQAALLTASGMAAMTLTMLTFLQQGDHIILTDDCYRRTRDFSRQFLKKFGVQSSVVALNDFDTLEKSIRPNTRMLISETPTNPYLRVLDVERIAHIARKHAIKTLIDSTFATPFNLHPLDYGIDLVVHSGTKYLGGHHDLLSGVVIGSAADLESIRDISCTLGPIADPFSAYLLLRGLKTLALRVRHQNESALAVAHFLEQQPEIEQVFYPGLTSHPDHAIAKAQMKGFGGVISFTMRANLEQTGHFIDLLKIPYISPSLGGAESLVNQPALMSYSSISAEERAAIGIQDNLVRLALGLEDSTDMIADLQQALAGWQR